MGCYTSAVAPPAAWLAHSSYPHFPSSLVSQKGLMGRRSKIGAISSNRWLVCATREKNLCFDVLAGYSLHNHPSIDFILYSL